jgi:hypothetical protein
MLYIPPLAAYASVGRPAAHAAAGAGDRSYSDGLSNTSQHPGADPAAGRATAICDLYELEHVE